MGSAFEFIVVAENDREGERLLDLSVAEVRRLEALLTEFSETSQTALLNRSAGGSPVAVDPEVYALIARCLDLSRLTGGAFDITAGALRRLYNFKNPAPALPSPTALAEARQKVGFEKIRLLDGHRLRLSEAGMRIGFGAIGKGYAADRVKALLLAEGVRSGVINASGDLVAWGRRPDGEPWRVGIARPEAPAEVLLWLPVDGQAVATSGDYEQFFEIDGQRYSHNLNPLTGLPVTGLRSVSVISPSAELSDALATAVFVMGAGEGLSLIEQLPQTHALVVDGGGELHVSKGLEIKPSTFGAFPALRKLTALFFLLFFFACQTVKPYQRAYLNDAEMQLGTDELRKPEANAHAYREGAAGGGAGKSGGGCGCN